MPDRVDELRGVLGVGLEEFCHVVIADLDGDGAGGPVLETEPFVGGHRRVEKITLAQSRGGDSRGNRGDHRGGHQDAV